MDLIVSLPVFTCSKLTIVNTIASNISHLVLVFLFSTLNMGCQIISMNPCKINTHFLDLLIGLEIFLGSTILKTSICQRILKYASRPDIKTVIIGRKQTRYSHRCSQPPLATQNFRKFFLRNFYLLKLRAPFFLSPLTLVTIMESCTSANLHIGNHEKHPASGASCIISLLQETYIFQFDTLTVDCSGRDSYQFRLRLTLDNFNRIIFPHFLRTRLIPL